MSATGNALRTRRGAGFTLLELLIVLALLTLAAVAIPWAVRRASPGRALDLAARDLVLDLRRARTAAEREHRSVAVVLEPNAAGMRIEALGRIETFTDGITLQAEDATTGTGSAPTLEFFPDGSATGAHWRLGLPGRHYRISVGAVTGEIRVEAG